jgi:hypothetical protein
MPFPKSFTTTPFERSSTWRFEVFSCKPTPGGLLPSLVQHRKLAPAFVTHPSECVSLNWPGFENQDDPRRSCGGGNVGIGFIDFQGLWEGRKTALSFSALSINRHFHGLIHSSPTFQAAIFVNASAQSCSNFTGLT